MNQPMLISFLCIFSLHLIGGKVCSSQANELLRGALTETGIEEDTTRENQVIKEVIKSKTTPAKDKTEFINQFSKYGFRDLFANYKYNTALPYNSQINPNAAMFIQDYMKAHGNYLQTMKAWGQPYFNLIESVLRQYGLPKELKYIAVIESNLNTGATSIMGAGGPWQFMPYTARTYGLTVNGYRDERRDYFKSTHAAARYLLALYGQMHDWLLVMAAYNGGAGNVYTAMRKSGSKNFWDLQYYLPSESRTYVKRFIATHYIMEGTGGITTTGGPAATDATEGIENGRPFAGSAAGPVNASATAPSPSRQALAASVLSISGRYNALVIARSLAMDIGLFNQYNPNFDQLMSTTGNFELRLPPDKMQLFLANKYDILNESVQLLLSGASAPVSPATSSRRGQKKKS